MEEWEEERSEASAHLRPVMVAPVGASGSGRMVSPLLTQVLKNQTISKFDGKEEQWEQWRWELEEMTFKRLSLAKALTETKKTQMLELALVGPLLDEYRSMQRHEHATYTTFMANMQMRYGRTQSTTARRKWEMVELVNHGHVTLQNWREFEIKFKEAYRNVPDATPDEAYRLLFIKIPECLRTSLLEHVHQIQEH